MAESYQVTTSDVVPAITIDHVNRLSKGIQTLMKLLNIADVKQYQAGYSIPIYKTVAVNTPSQVAEGETITLTEIKRSVAKTITLGLSKYRKATTAEAIAKSGKEVAINDTDKKLISIAQNDIKASIFDGIEDGSGAANAGATLQAALANIWAEAQEYYEDDDVEMVYFINPSDVASYLADHQITLENAFGFRYVEDFLSLGTAIITSSITAGAPIGTAKENLNVASIAGAGSDLADSFGLTVDESGLVGMTHTVASDNATIETLIMSGATFYAEDLDGVIIGEIEAPEEGE